MQSMVSCRTTNSLIQYASSRAVDIGTLLERCPFPEDHLTQVYDWVPEDIALALFERAAQMLDEENLGYKVGLSAAAEQVLGGVELLARLMGSPSHAYQEIARFPPYFDERAKFTVQFNGRSSALITMHHPMEHPKSKHMCSYVRGIIASVPTLWNLPRAVIWEKQCILPVERAGPLKGKSYRVDREGTVFQSDSVAEGNQEQAIGKISSNGTFEVNGVVYGAGACVYEVSWVEHLPWYKKLVLPLIRQTLPAIHERSLQEQALVQIERDELLIQKMRELQQLKSDLLLTFAHELETPLASLKSSANLLIEEVDDPAHPSLSRLASIIQRSAERIDELASSLLYIERLEVAELETSPTPYDVALPIVEAVAQMSALVERKGQRIEIEALPSGVMTNMLLDRFKVILDNLLSNAHRFTPKRGRISVALRKERKGFTVEVSDTGIGVPEEEQERIFAMFYRCKRVRRDGIAGNGLGLSIVKQLVEMYSGKIWVSSTVGKGSTFYLSLPIATN